VPIDLRNSEQNFFDFQDKRIDKLFFSKNRQIILVLLQTFSF